MNFTLTWTPAAQRQLGAFWLSQRDRYAVTAASYRIEARILADPTGAGESRAGNWRYLHDDPLAVIYRVFPARQLAVVIAAGPSNPRRRP